MVDKTSDILGGGPIPLRPLHSTPWYKNPNKVGPILVLFFAGYILFRQASLRFVKWQEKSYKLATRRRYGIPDNDHRPFNVAYAAVNRERQARNTASRSTPVPQSASQPQSSGRNDGQTRQRFNSTGLNSAIPSWAAPQTTGYQSGSPYRSSQNFPTAQTTQSAQQNRTHRSGRRTLDLSRPSNNDRKRAFDDGDYPDSDHAKKTRVEGEELIDGDEDAGWQDDGLNHRNARGSKRLYADEELSEDDVEPSKRIRDKRARKVAREHTPEDHIMVDEDDQAEDDEVAELKAFSRGKKRDRGEAGSSFGGDDEERVDDEGYESSKVYRSRKRRTVHKRNSEAHGRGSKRDRNADSYESDGADDDRMKGRVRRAVRSIGDSSDDALVSKDPLCKGRQIGEEWELNGVQYKVGPNGDRLRQALIKKARSKFNMPKDSEHPDRAANMEVYVETWLTEEQYNDAKERQQLAWQSSGSTSVEPESSQSPPESPKKVGKDLLWTSTVPCDVPRRRNASRQSIATNIGFRSNPFENPLPSPSRRVASAYAGPPPDILSISMSSSTGSGASSPRPVHRSFSKWEKQDLEAEAIRKMRSKVQEQKKVAEEKKMAEAATTTIPAPAPSCVPPATTTVTSFANPKTTEVPAISNPAKARANTPSLIVPVAVKESAQPTASASAASFGPSATTTPSFTLAPSSASATPQPQSTGNMFANGVSTRPAIASSPLAAPFTNAVATPAAPSLSPKPFLGFGAFTPTSSAPPPPAATAFSFGNNAASNKQTGAQSPLGFPAQPAQKEEPALPSSTSGPNSNSLLARLGQAPAASTPTFFGNSSSPAVNTSEEHSKMNAPSFPFGQNQTNPSSTTPASTPAAAPLKFNFGKPAATTAAPSPSPSTAVPTFGTPANISEVTRSPFGAPAKPAETPAANFFVAAKPAGATDKPLFSFGKAAGAAPATSNSTTPFPAANGAVSPFGPGAGNAFSSASAAPVAKGFGNAGGVFGGVGSATPTAAADGTAANGARTPSGAPPALFPKAAEGSTTAFSFGASSASGTGAATAKPTSSPMAFKFGSAVSPSSPSPFGAPAAMNGTTTPGLFGQKSTAAKTTPAAFGFGTGSGFSFGTAPPTPGAEQK